MRKVNILHHHAKFYISSTHNDRNFQNLMRPRIAIKLEFRKKIHVEQPTNKHIIVAFEGLDQKEYSKTWIKRRKILWSLKTGGLPQQRE